MGSKGCSFAAHATDGRRQVGASTASVVQCRDNATAAPVPIPPLSPPAPTPAHALPRRTATAGSNPFPSVRFPLAPPADETLPYLMAFLERQRAIQPAF